MHRATTPYFPRSLVWIIPAGLAMIGCGVFGFGLSQAGQGFEAQSIDEQKINAFEQILRPYLIIFFWSVMAAIIAVVLYQQDEATRRRQRLFKSGIETLSLEELSQRLHRYRVKDDTLRFLKAQPVA